MASKKKARTSYHARQRIEQRADNRLELVNYAFKKGLTASAFNGKLKYYIYSKQKGKTNGHLKVTIYKGYVFIFQVFKKRLITMYPLPERYLQEYQARWKQVEESRKYNER